jgi:hypothetical protein
MGCDVGAIRSRRAWPAPARTCRRAAWLRPAGSRRPAPIAWKALARVPTWITPSQIAGVDSMHPPPIRNVHRCTGGVRGSAMS